METDTNRVQLVDLKGMEAVVGKQLAGFSVNADLASAKDALPGTIELRLEYRNDGPRDTELLNPVDHVQYMILDAAGYPVKMPPFAPRPLINTGDESEIDLSDKFEIVSIREHGREKDVRAELHKRTITVSSGGSYEILLRIRKMLDERRPDIPIEILPGDYQIVLTCGLVTSGDDGGEKRFLQSAKVPITVR